MMPPDALHGWAPWTGQWCSFAISSLRRTRATYGFRARFDSGQLVAVRLEWVAGLTRDLGGGKRGDVMLLPRFEDGPHTGPPLAVPEDVVIQNERPDVRRPDDSDEVCEGPFRVFLRIMFGHVRHRAVHIQDRRLRIDEERELFLQRRADHVRRVDEDFAPLGDPCHDDVPEFIIVAVGHRRREEELRPAEVHLVFVPHLNLLRIGLQLADERARTFTLTPVDVELPVFQEGELAAENGRRRWIVMVEMVVADREDVRLLRGATDDLPQFLLSRPLGRMGTRVVPVRAKSDAWVQEDGDVRRLDERRHGSRAEAVRGERRNLHRITAWPHIYRETTDRISVAMAVAAAAGLAAS